MNKQTEMEITVAASNSSSEDKGIADYTCPATNPLTYITHVVLGALPSIGGTIKFLKGEFQASNSTDKIEIKNRRNISLRGSPGAIICNPSGSYEKLISIKTSSHISIENFVIDGKLLQGEEGRATSMVYIWYSNYTEIKNNIIKNSFVGVLGIRSSYVNYTNNIFDTALDEGICHMSGDYCLFEENTFTKCYADCCLEVQSNSNNNTFRNNIFENSRSGMLFMPAGDKYRNNIIKNNVFRKLVRGAILMYNSEETEIVHNDFYECAMDTQSSIGWDIISLGSGSDNNKINENTIRAVVKARCGIRIGDECKSNSVTGNTFHGSFLEAPICDYGIDTEIIPAEGKRTVIFDSYPQGATIHVLKRS